jgi:DNA helicase-2/ATP-dependent DNA helicase PcrA
MTLSSEESVSIESEERIFKDTTVSLVQQIANAEDRLYHENQRARMLTSEILETRRAEDKSLLASDEAVSHSIKDSKREEIDVLKKQLPNPYFARIRLEEELPSGDTTTIEYKLGLAANTDCRIIDWRRAPIAKLYYEYKEGEEYCEEILGRERIGRVTLRNRIEVSGGKLSTITNRYGSFAWNSKTLTWESRVGGGPRRKQTDGHLPEILSLITAEQFRSITVDASTAVLIQGIAGSGKTTVALHRLAWLLHHDNSELVADDCVFLVLSPALRAYIENSLPSVGITGVKIRTYHEWAGRLFRAISPRGEVSIERPMNRPSIRCTRVKRSLALLKAIERSVCPLEAGSPPPIFADLQSELLRILSCAETVCSLDDTRLLDSEAVKVTHDHTAENFSHQVLDWEDDGLLLRIYQCKTGVVFTERNSLGKYGHVLVDEVQDLSPVELATVISSVKHHRDVTLVGDTSQSLDATQSFPGWEQLRTYWNFTDDVSSYVSLEVSHRSTAPIMKLADHIQQRDVGRGGRPGRTPIWFKCRNESQGIECVIKWLTKAVELYPTMVTAVVCATPQEARTAFKMLQPTFGQLVRLADHHSFSFEEGILVTDVHNVKGLEFFSVLLWNPSARAYASDSLGRNLLYVAVTRAEENLSVVTWERPAKALPVFGVSGIMRWMDMTLREDEE